MSEVAVADRSVCSISCEVLREGSFEMRASSLLSVLMLLQTRGRMSAPDARRFAVYRNNVAVGLISALD